MNLTKTETSRLHRLEAVIRDGMQQFVAVGNALLEIRDARLYRTTHETFESYCQDRWQMSKTHANRLILGAQAVEQIGSVEVRPTAESQVRELTSLPPDRRSKAWSEAVAAAGGRRPTAAQVRNAVHGVMDAAPATRRSSSDVVFLHRVRFVAEFREWARSEGVDNAIINKISVWISSRL